ncbi:unnamed protein product [Prunus armeniaca]
MQTWIKVCCDYNVVVIMDESDSVLAVSPGHDTWHIIVGGHCSTGVTMTSPKPQAGARASPFCWVPPSRPGLPPLLETSFYPKPHCWKQVFIPNTPPALPQTPLLEMLLIKWSMITHKLLYCFVDELVILRCIIGLAKSLSKEVAYLFAS